ncbi:MAG TPA: LytTR family DNA-binding domain-containing protein [Parapedobacter sp.]|nr:LytTR family DNA-binding domain-containing protein [Parapedobacter sp.]
MKHLFTYVLIEDNPADANAMQSLLEKFDELECVGVFTDAQAGKAFLLQNDVDFLFLDIDMKGLSGIELLRLLPKRPVTVFCTSYDQFMAEGIDLEVADYLLKPVPFDRLVNAVSRAKRRLGQPYEGEIEVYRDYINVKIDNGIRKFIALADINYVRAANHDCHLSLVGSKPDEETMVFAKQSFGSVVAYLPEKQFFKTHRSFVVALDRIEEIHAEFVKLSIPKGKMISITKGYLAKLINRTGTP